MPADRARHRRCYYCGRRRSPRLGCRLPLAGPTLHHMWAGLTPRRVWACRDDASCERESAKIAMKVSRARFPLLDPPQECAVTGCENCPCSGANTGVLCWHPFAPPATLSRKVPRGLTAPTWCPLRTQPLTLAWKATPGGPVKVSRG